MPRKTGHGVDYDDYEDYSYHDDYDDYNDYNNLEYGRPLNGAVPVNNNAQETVKTRVWRCPICTFDNDDELVECDICGVLRNPLVKGSSNGNIEAVGGRCKDSGASIMAKSLFASLPNRKSNTTLTPLAQKGDFMLGELRNIHRDSCGFCSSPIGAKSNIAPFKFDVPSPDDIVSKGMLSSKMGSKAVGNRSASDVQSKNIKDSIEVELDTTEDHDDSSVSTSKGRNKGSNFSPEFEAEEEIISSNMTKISLSSKPATVKSVQARSVSIPPYKPEKWMLPDGMQERSNQLNLAIVGHVDSGKSTLSGRLLQLSGRISQKEMHKYEKEAKQQGKGSFAYAWALDESAEERERGITMTVAVAYFDSKNYHVVLLDSPGHRDFVPNMISGATQADAAILVIDASLGAFEAGIDASRGQTREHAQLIRSFGVDQIIVAVNKMDAVDYSVDRFGSIRKQLGTFLRSYGFKDSSVFWVPISAMENQNLVAGPSDTRFSWCQGPCLLNAVDSLQSPARDYSKPLRVPICDVLKSQGQVSISGKVETGALRPGSKVLVMPGGEMGSIRSLERDTRACNVARAGDNVTVNIQGIEGNQVIAGGVLCHPDFPVAVCNHLELKILVLDITTPILIGSQLEFHVHHAKEAARVVKILGLLDPKTGKQMKKSPRCLLAKQNAIVEVKLEGDVCVEEYTKCRSLGRVSLRASGRTIALGVITRTIDKDE